MHVTRQLADQPRLVQPLAVGLNELLGPGRHLVERPGQGFDLPGPANIGPSREIARLERGDGDEQIRQGICDEATNPSAPPVQDCERRDEDGRDGDHGDQRSRVDGVASLVAELRRAPAEFGVDVTDLVDEGLADLHRALVDGRRIVGGDEQDHLHGVPVVPLAGERVLLVDEALPVLVPVSSVLQRVDDPAVIVDSRGPQFERHWVARHLVAPHSIVGFDDGPQQHRIIRAQRPDHAYQFIGCAGWRRRS